MKRAQVRAVLTVSMLNHRLGKGAINKSDISHTLSVAMSRITMWTTIYGMKHSPPLTSEFWLAGGPAYTWGPWSPGTCSATCGTCTMTRVRQREGVCGPACAGPSTDSSPCALGMGLLTHQDTPSQVPASRKHTTHTEARSCSSTFHLRFMYFVSL